MAFLGLAPAAASQGADEDDFSDLPPLRCIRPKKVESKFQIGQKAGGCYGGYPLEMTDSLLGKTIGKP